MDETEVRRDPGDLVGYFDRVRGELGRVLGEYKGRFTDGDRLLGRFDAAVERLLTRGWDHLDEVTEVHNELCTAVLLLEDHAEPKLRRVAYEPAMDGCGRRFDFRVDFDAYPSAWVEVKTIHPQRLDGWQRYEEALTAGRFPENARLILDRSWLGGELFHKYFAARAKILEYTVQTEKKVAQCLPQDRGKVFLLLFSNGFDWHVDDLEDFLHYYRLGVHFDGDHFRLMEAHHIAQQGIRLAGSIDCIGYVRRSSSSIRVSGGTWDVKPVRFDPDRGFH